MSLRDRVLAAPTRKTKPVNISEWGETIHVRELDGDQRLAFLASVDPNDPRVDLNALTPHLADLVVDAEGATVFELADVDTLKRDHPGAVQKILMAAIEQSDLGEADAEDAEGNSEATPEPALPT